MKRIKFYPNVKNAYKIQFNVFKKVMKDLNIAKNAILRKIQFYKKKDAKNPKRRREMSLYIVHICLY